MSVQIPYHLTPKYKIVCTVIIAHNFSQSLLLYLLHISPNVALSTLKFFIYYVSAEPCAY